MISSSIGELGSAPCCGWKNLKDACLALPTETPSITSDCKINGHFQYKPIVFQGKFSILSAVQYKKSRKVGIRLQYQYARVGAIVVIEQRQAGRWVWWSPVLTVTARGRVEAIVQAQAPCGAVVKLVKACCVDDERATHGPALAPGGINSVEGSTQDPGRAASHTIRHAGHISQEVGLIFDDSGGKAHRESGEGRLLCDGLQQGNGWRQRVISVDDRVASEPQRGEVRWQWRRNLGEEVILEVDRGDPADESHPAWKVTQPVVRELELLHNARPVEDLRHRARKIGEVVALEKELAEGYAADAVREGGQAGRVEVPSDAGLDVAEAIGQRRDVVTTQPEVDDRQLADALRQRRQPVVGDVCTVRTSFFLHF